MVQKRNAVRQGNVLLPALFMPWRTKLLIRSEERTKDQQADAADAPNTQYDYQRPAVRSLTFSDGVFWLGRQKEITNELNGLNVIIKEYGLGGDWGFQGTWTQISEQKLTQW